MPDGFVLDAYPDPERGEMVLWVRTDRGDAVRYAEPFTPDVFVRARDPRRLDDLTDALAPVHGLGALEVTEARCGLEDAPSRVLRVPVKDPRRVARVAQMIDANGDHRDFALFDVDLRTAHRYFVAKGLWPFARVRAWAPGRYRVRDDAAWAVAYPRPDLRVMELAAAPDAPAGDVPTEQTPVKRAWVRADGDAAPRVFTGPERDVLDALNAAVADVDPDVVLTDGGDAFTLPYLAARAAHADVPLQLGREPDPAPPRRGRSFFTYGRVKYQAPPFRLHGRLHIDRASSFFHAEAGLHGIVDLARVSHVPVQDLARLGAGTALTAIQVHLAKAQGRLVPWKKNVPEAFKTARELLLADRGGYIFEPRVGVHEDVVEFDYASLYPNIMVRHNISPETVLCACCRPRDLPFTRVTPQIGSWTCARREGFIPQYLAPVIRRREHFKTLRKRDPGNAAAHKQVSDAYKWLLVTSFGYQGYKNAKFGRIECHEAINAWGREILLTAAEVARDHGFDLVHGIVDSLWLKRLVPGADPGAFAREVERVTGIPFEYEGRYKWIVFLPTRAHPEDDVGPAIGALNRYYGCFDAPPGKGSRSQAGQPVDHLAGGALKVRGVELRQRSTPPVIREVQERFLTEVAEAGDAAAFRARVPRALEAARPVIRRILDGACPLDALVYRVSVSRDAGAYRVLSCQAAAVKQLARRGVRVPPGDTVRYVITDEASRDPERKVVETRLLRGDEAYDRDAYARHAIRALASLTRPLGWDEAALAAHYAGVRQLPLTAFA